MNLTFLKPNFKVPVAGSTLPIITLYPRENKKRDTISFNNGAVKQLDLFMNNKDKVIVFNNYMINDKAECVIFSTDKSTIEVPVENNKKSKSKVKKYKTHQVHDSTLNVYSKEMYDIICEALNLDCTLQNHVLLTPTDAITGGAFVLSVYQEPEFNKGQDIEIIKQD
jgi:hypothetical protein